MALPMVHLIAAYNWARKYPELFTCPEYYMGTLAPDAIHIRDGHDKSHKNETHLNNWRKSDPEPVLAYLKDHKTPFDVGYSVHVLLDGQWTERFRERLPGMLLPDGKPDPDIYYNDTIINDFRFYREFKPRDELFKMLTRARAPKDHPILTEFEIRTWTDEIVNCFYNKHCPKSNPVCFFTEEYIESFLKECGELFTKVLEEAEIISTL